LPNFSTLPDLDANIAAQLRQLRRPPPKQPINAIRVEGTRLTLSGSAAARMNKPVLYQQETLFAPTQIPGVFHVTWQDGDDRTEQISLFGMIPVSQMLYNADEQSVFQVDRLELRGDWDTMPVYEQLGYWQRSRVTDLMTNQSNRESEVICKVIRELPASELYPQLRGQAKELKCHVVGNRVDEISSYYYLMDYGIGFLQGSTSGRYTQNSRVTEIR
jgi:hypothetical protein